MLKSQAGRGTPLATNAWRCLAGAACLLLLLAALGSGLSGAWGTVLLFLGASTLTGVILGDTIYIRALRLADLAVLFPVSMAGYFLFTVLLAALVLKEPLSWQLPMAGALILAGIYLLATPATSLRFRGGQALVGMLLALLASLGWATSVTLLRKALPDLDVIAANAVRLPMAALVLLTLASVETRGLPFKGLSRRSLALIAVIGILDFAAGGVFFLLAIKYAGAAKAALLSSTSPLFLLPLSVFVLREKPSSKVLLGTGLTVIGIILIF